jgi:hypothetical protein
LDLAARPLGVLDGLVGEGAEEGGVCLGLVLVKDCVFDRDCDLNVVLVEEEKELKVVAEAPAEPTISHTKGSKPS